MGQDKVKREQLTRGVMRKSSSFRPRLRSIRYLDFHERVSASFFQIFLFSDEKTATAFKGLSSMISFSFLEHGLNTVENCLKDFNESLTPSI